MFDYVTKKVIIEKVVYALMNSNYTWVRRDYVTTFIINKDDVPEIPGKFMYINIHHDMFSKDNGKSIEDKYSLYKENIRWYFPYDDDRRCGMWESSLPKYCKDNPFFIIAEYYKDSDVVPELATYEMMSVLFYAYYHTLLNYNGEVFEMPER